MYDQEILQELYQANNYLYSNGKTESAIFNKLNDLQDQINSGDNMINQQFEYTKNMLGLESLILMAILLYLFIVRSMK